MQNPVSIIKWVAAGLIALAVVGVSLYRFQHRPLDKAYPELFAENLEYKFRTYAIQITGKQSLYVAKLKTQESITRTSYANLLWFQLPPMVLKIDVPVEYNYFVNLSGGWRFEVEGETLVVTVPELGSSTPALDISKLQTTVEEGSVFRNEKKALEVMTRELPGLLIDRAINNRELVREEARESVGKFVRTWLVQATGENFERPLRIQFPHDGLPTQKSR